MNIIDHFYSKEKFQLEEITSGIYKTKNIPEDIGRYYNSENYISHRNKKEGLKEKLYSLVQKWNLNYKLTLLKKYTQGNSLLDYGCGNGIFLEFIKNKGYKIQGIEPSEKGKEETEKRLNIHLKNSIEEVEKTDIITLWHVLEHIPNPREILHKLADRLNDKGKLVIAIPNHKSYDADYYKEFWAAWDVPRHLFHYSKEGFIKEFSKEFKIEHTAPLLFDSYYISLLSEQYKKNSMAFLKALYIGWKSNQKAKKTGNYSSMIYILSKKEDN